MTSKPDELEVARVDTDRGPVITVTGHLDLATGPTLEQAIREAEREGVDPLVIDVAGLEFLDSTALQLLLDADLRAQEGGRSVVVRTGEGEAKRVFSLAGVADRLGATTLA